MGFEGYDWQPTDDDVTYPRSSVDCPGCGTALTCNREWRVHVEGDVPRRARDLDAGLDDAFDPHSFSCSHDHIPDDFR